MAILPQSTTSLLTTLWKRATNISKSGRLVKKTEVEKTDSDSQGTEHEISTYGYRDDGHWAYTKTKRYDYSETTEFIYDSNGIWTDAQTKFDEAEESSEYSLSSQTRATAGTQQSQMPASDPNLTEDMSDGEHNIDISDGNWRFNGNYYVFEGKIEFGEYVTYFMSDCSAPQNPELNYTDPAMPLEEDDGEYANAVSNTWHYSWDTANQEWKLEYGPSSANCTYRDGDLVKTDTYNIDRQITHTTVYSFDSLNRLVRTVSSATGSPSTYTQYTYLDDTDYLSTRYTSDNNELRRYYYSTHDYVDPTGIDNATVKPVTGDDRYYDLLGQPVANPANGIYIHHGRKVLIKKANF